jgi:hypothetical protein
MKLLYDIWFFVWFSTVMISAGWSAANFILDWIKTALLN